MLVNFENRLYSPRVVKKKSRKEVFLCAIFMFFEITLRHLCRSLQQSEKSFIPNT